MRIVLAHNYYQQQGGEDVVFAAERDLLRVHGHQVEVLTDHNDRINGMSAARLALDTIWSRSSYRAARALLRRTRAQVLHVHNSFPLLSPSLYDAARAERVPVVQTLHNWRLVCPAATLFRDGAPCRACLDTVLPWPGVRYGCYQGSRARTLGVATMVTLHRLRRTWQRAVARYVVMSEQARAVFAEAGLPVGRLVVKPHFVAPDPGPGPGDGGYALFVGRLAEGKGLETVGEAWRRIEGLPLKVVGDGPLYERLATVAAAGTNVELLGHRSRDEVRALMARAAFVVFASESYETFGLVVIEAFAHGTPAVVARVGSPAELVTDGVNGATFAAGDAADLAAVVRRLVGSPPTLASLRANARKAYLDRFTAERNYEQLVAVYRDVIDEVARRP